jgi:glycosyltransferase involved in cell wall biosynthesis
VIHTDVPFDELVRLYGESAIYWHASGFGEDENREPIKFEHFGITTVEAMASGCVPVVIGKGGQPEIVRHGRNGFLWYTIGQLKALTWQLIADASLRQRLASVAINDSRRYDRAHFHARLRELLQQIGVDL